MKLPHVLCQVLVESGLEHGALIRRQIKRNRNVRAAGWVWLRAEMKPPSLARPSPGPEVPELGCEARGCSSTKPLLPPGSRRQGYPSRSDSREAQAGCAKPGAAAAARAPQPRVNALLLPVPAAAHAGLSARSSAHPPDGGKAVCEPASTGSVASWLNRQQDQAAASSVTWWLRPVTKTQRFGPRRGGSNCCWGAWSLPKHGGHTQQLGC